MGVHIVIDRGKEYDYAIKLAFKTTNNETKYVALFSSLKIAKSMGAMEAEVRANSQAVVSQVPREFTTKSEKLKKYLTLIEAKRTHFRYF